MFGYLNIEKAKLQEGQEGVWQTFMCGMCMSTKRQFGNVPRLFISNDVNFFNVLFHSVLGLDVEAEQRRCASSPIKKRPVLKQTPLVDKLSAANVLLTYWNLYDDVVDGGSPTKRAALGLVKKAYHKAQALLPQLDQMLCRRYDELRQMEQAGTIVLDAVAHSFAQLSADFAAIVLQDECSEHLSTLCYNLGKWIYLVDALDDVERDLSRGNYNPFAACYGATSAEQLAAKQEELRFLMFAVLNRVAMSFNDLNLTKYNCILQNVLYHSIRDKTLQVLARYDPAKPAHKGTDRGSAQSQAR